MFFDGWLHKPSDGIERDIPWATGLGIASNRFEGGSIGITSPIF